MLYTFTVNANTDCPGKIEGVEIRGKYYTVRIQLNNPMVPGHGFSMTTIDDGYGTQSVWVMLGTVASNTLREKGSYIVHTPGWTFTLIAA